MPKLNQSLAYTTLETPIGTLLVAGDGASLHLVSFPEGSRTRRPEPGWCQDGPVLRNVTAELRAYFACELNEFTILVTLTGTVFQKAVWTALLAVPFGKTASYGDIAKRIGLPSASRAVGAANGANPVPIVVPCHRIVGSNGALTGFGGGLPTKQYLIDHERLSINSASVAARATAFDIGDLASSRC